jgi:hypothetical protein
MQSEMVSFHTNMLKYLCVINHSVFVGEKVEGQSKSNVAIFGTPLRQSLRYANVAISISDGNQESHIYGYLPIIVAQCGWYIKEKGL